jgi:hypothetical protein
MSVVASANALCLSIFYFCFLRAFLFHLVKTLCVHCCFLRVIHIYTADVFSPYELATLAAQCLYLYV